MSTTSRTAMILLIKVDDRRFMKRGCCHGHAHTSISGCAAVEMLEETQKSNEPFVSSRLRAIQTLGTRGARSGWTWDMLTSRSEETEASRRHPLRNLHNKRLLLHFSSVIMHRRARVSRLSK